MELSKQVFKRLSQNKEDPVKVISCFETALKLYYYKIKSNIES